MARSKRYNEIKKLVDASKSYTIEEALELLPKISNRKNDESVELHIALSLNEKQLAKGLSGTYTLPHSVAKEIRIVVLADSQNQSAAKKAGADEVGFEDLVKKIEDGWSDFDVLIATPDIMPKIAKLGKTLGPKGLMPSPRNETITTQFNSSYSTIPKKYLECYWWLSC